MRPGRLFRRTAGWSLAAGLVGCGGTPTTPTPPAPAACVATPGAVCFGARNYVEFAVGDLPVVVSVPHGGALAPASIPDRTVGTSVTDTNTIELGRAIAASFVSLTGRAPHIVICHLRRTKLDANRDVGEAAQGHPDATTAWNDYHGFVEAAIRAVVDRFGRGLYIDLHGHGHAKARLELGYLLSSATLDRTDAELNGSGAAVQSSLRLALATTRAPFAELLRGATSLGGLLAPGVPAVPSPADPTPGSDPYFDGGYSTVRHTTVLPGLQIETHFPGLRDSATNRAAFGAALASAVSSFLSAHLDVRIAGDSPNPLPLLARVSARAWPDRAARRESRWATSRPAGVAGTPYGADRR
jgi:hypothetical protein